jgi:hypothetical protein
VNKRNLLWSALIASSPLFTLATAAASEAEPPALSSAASTPPRHWLVRAEASLVNMQDAWLFPLGPEVGLTVGRDLTPRFSVELTGNAREVSNHDRRSWSALAAGRWAALVSTNGRHALTIAGGPFLEIDNVVHGTLPFAHAELAYVYRAPVGFTMLAGMGWNIALASSPYVAPPKQPCDPNMGDSFTFCIDLGPDAQEIHAGDANAAFRLAVGWLF